jgi:hypothetical protein
VGNAFDLAKQVSTSSSHTTQRFILINIPRQLYLLPAKMRHARVRPAVAAGAGLLDGTVSEKSICFVRYEYFVITTDVQLRFQH